MAQLGMRRAWDSDQVLAPFRKVDECTDRLTEIWNAMRVAAPAIHAMAAGALQYIVGACGLLQASGFGRNVRRNVRRNIGRNGRRPIRRYRLRYAKQDGGGAWPPPSPCLPSSPRPHGFGAAFGGDCGLASPTMTDVVQWKIDDSFDMHQLMSLCRNI